MALLTDLPLDDATELLSLYGLELVALSPLSAGSVNSNFFLEGLDDAGTTHTYFARIYEEQGEEGAEFELRLNEALHRAGIPAARPVPLRDGRLFTLYEGKPFAVYEKLSGDVICQKGVTPSMCAGLGAVLARVHSAPLGDLKIAESRFGFDGILERLRRVEDSGRKDLLPAVQRIRTLCERLRSERSASLPSGLIHGDLFRDNVLLRDENVVGLLDFESASRGPFVYDLMVTVLAWCFGDHLRADLCRSMVEGYVSVRPLSEEERQAMVLEGSIACVRFATTRLTDFSLRAPEGTKPLRDYRRFFERLDALEGGTFTAAIKDIF